MSAVNAVANSPLNHEKDVIALDVASGSKSLRGLKMPDMTCPGENVMKHGLVYICHDARKDTCQSINIVSDGRHVEIYICQNPNPVEEKRS